MTRILDADGGMVETFHYDHAGDRTIVRLEQDVEPILKRNKSAYNAAPSRFGDMAHVATVPMVLIEKWGSEDGINYLAPENRKALLAKLNDPDNRFLRTRPGRL